MRNKILTDIERCLKKGKRKKSWWRTVLCLIMAVLCVASTLTLPVAKAAPDEIDLKEYLAEKDQGGEL